MLMQHLCKVKYTVPGVGVVCTACVLHLTRRCLPCTVLHVAQIQIWLVAMESGETMTWSATNGERFGVSRPPAAPDMGKGGGCATEAVVGSEGDSGEDGEDGNGGDDGARTKLLRPCPVSARTAADAWCGFRGAMAWCMAGIGGDRGASKGRSGGEPEPGTAPGVGERGGIRTCGAARRCWVCCCVQDNCCTRCCCWW